MRFRVWILKDVQFILAADQSFTHKQGALRSPRVSAMEREFLYPVSLSLTWTWSSAEEAVSEYTDPVWSLSDTYVNYVDSFSCWTSTILAVGKEVKYIMWTQTDNNWRFDYCAYTTHQNLGRQEWPKNQFQYLCNRVLTGPLALVVLTS